MTDWWIKATIVPAVTVFALGLIGATIKGRASVDAANDVAVLNYSQGSKRMIALCALALIGFKWYGARHRNNTLLRHAIARG